MLGRAKDHFRRENGELGYLFDIEEAILKNENVEQCKVVSFQGPEGIETVAHIVFNQSITDEIVELKKIQEQLAISLPDYMIPHYYKTRVALPVNNNGKLDVGALSDDREALIPAGQLVS